MSAERLILLRELIAGRSSPSVVVERLAVFGWDCDEELVIMTRDDAVGLLSRFVSGEVNTARMAEWANAIEGRDDVGFEPAANLLLGELVFELANPEITRELAVDRAEWWIRRLDDTGSGGAV